ncbi:TrmB family transcriptional regulator [Actinophytocola xinjiangensis]|uniref:TrmB family transcriptional regulator n=1 Tax=Actinophytocola xinjiangensis TaxID=485602 RepID=A0A7Z0WM55_9PSEU|nr:helix-turn-helix domain-containing protein [Actinophytocola xinjiangensis]OLF10224.1 TrmB family transcriptional regulator [Actinophytocola xinjiangensis]
MLEAIGLTPTEERVYRAVLTLFHARPESVAQRLGIAEHTASDVLSSLHATGLVRRDAGQGTAAEYVPVAPDVAFGPLLLRGQESLESARSGVYALLEQYRESTRRRDPTQLIEVITGAAAIRHQVRYLQLGAREELLWFCRAGHIAMPSSDNTEEFDALARGVRYRVLYETALIEEPGMIDSVAAGVREGEQARASAALPIRLMIADRTVALCPLVQHTAGGAEPTAALVHDSSLLGALVALFESYWERGSPLLVDEPDDEDPEHLAPEERQLLSLLVGGVSDKAVATQLGVSQRTVQRRIYELMRRAGAQSRMQLAWTASRLGWLSD